MRELGAWGSSGDLSVLVILSRALSNGVFVSVYTSYFLFSTTAFEKNAFFCSHGTEACMGLWFVITSPKQASSLGIFHFRS